ncbi:MAG: metallopeptidase family protein [Terriglobales bacterium]
MSEEYFKGFLSPPWWDRDGTTDDPVDERESPPAAVDEDFAQKVQAAYETLPATIRALPDFPPIEILQEPVGSYSGRSVLGCFIGVSRLKKSQFRVTQGPTVIHIYQGPVTRYAGAELDAVLRTVVWHEVAHWLGFDTEEKVAELGLQLEPKGRRAT